MRLARPFTVSVTAVALAGFSAVSAPRLQAQSQGLSQVQAAHSSQARWSKLSVQLPASPALFSGAEQALVANSQCLICHSKEMVSSQPARTQAQWKETINKMRTAYGAPLPPEQIDALSAYLSALPPDSEGDLQQQQ